MCSLKAPHDRCLALRVITLATFVLSALTATAVDSRLADAVEKSDRTAIRALLQ